MTAIEAVALSSYQSKRKHHSCSSGSGGIFILVKVAASQ